MVEDGYSDDFNDVADDSDVTKYDPDENIIIMLNSNFGRT